MAFLRCDEFKKKYKKIKKGEVVRTLIARGIDEKLILLCKPRRERKDNTKNVLKV
jgi:hypothetical protein